VCGGSSGQVSVAAEAGCVGCGCGVDQALVLVQWVVEASALQTALGLARGYLCQHHCAPGG
jgi:hypothetical protein